MDNIKEREPTAAGTAASPVEDMRYPSTVKYTTNLQICQVLLNTIIEFADDIIGDEDSTADISSYAGTIKGLAMSIKEILGAGHG